MAQCNLYASKNHQFAKCVRKLYRVWTSNLQWGLRNKPLKVAHGKTSCCLVILILHYVQEVSYFKNLQVLGEWSVAPSNKCSSEMKAALLPRSYVEKVGQCTWGKNLLLLCSHPSNSVLIVSMNTFKLVVVFSPLLQMFAYNMPWPLPPTPTPDWKSPLRKCFCEAPLDCRPPPSPPKKALAS